MMNYIWNISGCLRKYNDVVGAAKWIQKAAEEIPGSDFNDLLWKIHEFIKSEWSGRESVTDLYLIVAKYSSTLSDRMLRDYKEDLKSRQQEKDRQAIEEARCKDEELKKKNQLEAESRRKESERLEIIKKEERRQFLLSGLRAVLETDFIGADHYYHQHCASIISIEEYKREKIEFVRGWFKSKVSESEQIPDDEQTAAIAAVNNHVQVVARAGSGKTLTIVNRAFFLQKHCRVLPQEMLLLAFNKDAVQKIKEDLQKVLKDNIPHIMTFHALAHGLVHPEEDLLYDDPQSENQGLSRTIQDVIVDHLRSKELYQQMRELMLAYFREDWVRIVEEGYDKSPEELLKYRRSLPRESLRGEPVKSYGEKAIADFLFEHAVPYWYEHNHGWGKNTYRPDFTIPKDAKSGVVIEYFGLAGDPDYDEQSKDKRDYWREKPEWSFLEFTPDDIKRGGVSVFRDALKAALEKEEIRCKRLSEEEIWQLVEKRAIFRFTKANVTFIGKCRKLGITPDALKNLINDYSPKSNVEKLFVNIAHRFYTAYLKRLTETGGEDFDGLLQRAIKSVYDGKTIFERKNERVDLKVLRYIFVDEYQDFSDLFHQLTKAIQAQNPDAKCFCVGDDWQAINGFAGSDLKFFKNFKHYFPSSESLGISTNYRSMKAIVAVGNTLMLGHGKPAVANKKSQGRVLLADLDYFEPTTREKEKHAGDNVTPLVLRLLAKVISAGHQVILLNRINSSIPYFNNQQNEDDTQGIKNYLKHLRKFLPKEMWAHISINTAHKYKGRQQHTVIVLDAVERRYPLIHQNWVFSQILGDDIEKVIAEERRLFYVALTRAVENLIIVTEGKKCSPFLSEMLGKSGMEKIVWSGFPPVRDTVGRLMVGVSNQKPFEIKDLLKADGFQFQDHPEKAWNKSFPVTGFSVDALKDTPWSKSADYIVVKVVDAQDKPIAHYTADAGGWLCVFSNIESIVKSDI